MWSWVAMPTPSAARFLFRTYTCEAGSSPISTTASVGVAPLAALKRSTPARTSPSTFSATGLPWRINAKVDSRGHAETPDVGGPPRLGIDDDDHAVQRSRPLGRLEAHRHLAEEPLQDEIAVHADDAFGRAGHAEVRDVGRAARQHALVGRLHMTVRADDRTHPPVEVPAHGERLAGGLAVHVHQHDRRVLAQLGDDLVGLAKWAVDGRHEHAAHEVQHGHAMRAG